jgi:hypothetical protein
MEGGVAHSRVVLVFYWMEADERGRVEGVEGSPNSQVDNMRLGLMDRMGGCIVCDVRISWRSSNRFNGYSYFQRGTVILSLHFLFSHTHTHAYSLT